jgi:hypothetical protein
MTFQRALIEEIKRAETDRVLPQPKRREHLRRVRQYGDALAFDALSRYSIRQLARNDGYPPALSGQGAGFDRVVETAAALSERVTTLISDLTNVLKNGDVVICLGPDEPFIFEVKAALPRQGYGRQGRRGRQLARIESIGQFLETGRGRIHGDEKERRTLETSHTPIYNFTMIDELVGAALRDQPTAVNPSAHEFCAAWRPGQSLKFAAAIEAIGSPDSRHFYLGSNDDRFPFDVSDLRPPLLWDVSPECRWALMEADVLITHGVVLEGFVGSEHQGHRIVGVTNVQGDIPWGLQVDVGEAEPVTVGAAAARDVAYLHETLESAAVGVVLVAQAFVAIVNAEEAETNSPTPRPTESDSS